MKTLKFKTNINCNGCIAKVSPALNKAEGITTWEVDITNPQKMLTVSTSQLNDDEIIAIVKGAGYNAEKIRDNE